MRNLARLAIALVTGLAVLLPTMPASARPTDASWAYSHTKHTGPAPWDKNWTLERDLVLPSLKGVGARNRSLVSLWVAAELAKELRQLRGSYVDNSTGSSGCSADHFPDQLRSTSTGSIVAGNLASVSIKFRSYEGCLGGTMYFTWPYTATWDLRTHRQLTLNDIVDLSGWSPEPALAAAINTLPGSCAPDFAMDGATIRLDTTRPRLRDRWTLDRRGVVFHLYGEEAGTPKWCEGPEVLLTWDQLPLTPLGARLARA